MGAKKYCVLGLMSGSSLDGLDLALCEFAISDSGISWRLMESDTIGYEEKWKLRLKKLPERSALEYVKTDTYLGHYFADLVSEFLEDKDVRPDFIASHGHTIYHYPDKLITAQIGCGATLAAKSGFPVVNGFRHHDIALEGEGTPLAHVADKFLFPGYDYYVNLGGIANISVIRDDGWKAFDVVPCNQILNSLARRLGGEYDENGQWASEGNMLPDLFEELNRHPFFRKPPPKSLDNQDIRKNIQPIVFRAEGSIEDKLHTFTSFIGFQIARAISKTGKSNEKKRLFLSGGGTFNGFLTTCIEEHIRSLQMEIDLVIPDAQIISFKESLLIALLGVLRVENKLNCYCEITGATENTINGGIYQGTKYKL